MSFAQENGYTPITFEALMDLIMAGVNLQFGTEYTTESFVGTNYYKYFYSLLQKVSENETKTAEIFQKLQEYIALTNERIQRPSVSHPGLLDSFAAHNFVASVKPPLEEDAGKIFICVDTDADADDYAATKLIICNLVKDFVAAGLISQGDQVESITLSNGQEFDFKFNLPNYIPVLLRLTIDVSENTLIAIPSDEVVRLAIFNQVNARYRLGFNFEPQRYYNLTDAPWAADLVLEWSDDDGANWHPEVYDAAYVDLFTFALEDIQVVFN